MERSSVTVRRLEPEEWVEFRALRLAALGADRLAFGSTLERESAYPDEKWRDWCRNGASDPHDATFVALHDGRSVGMAGVFHAEDGYHVWGMWVAPAQRRAGVGTALLRFALEWVALRAPGVPVLLDVNPTQEGAVRLYRAHGFEFTGDAQPLGHDPPASARRMVLPGRTAR
ncbi:MAG TPA: GNAT family N-acetyltransferase [Thermoplasmata archaeon]|nr:GNAT family N-acetyltransferase [Thermoplasmata archaeon]